ncbi:UDP-N-acetylglucosamine 4,6-dehydratase (inverting) [Clostridium uliginosum]|uniref:UDP-N-acetylglucosamine 4,6-dehydratase (Inverting) n=1 Tax=Clostridium uliginosum TaxID=119641 RepID=A0A1I1HP44_9CLOT|nr:UDP-N-acetylglucosamine 4,6-dehydratase (inverting) [Clostridium uliginosum]SFC22790.1 UDP-N-acetylglucosamine 4,6-dehydratase (inverting) [Clostridium uliginosum]
MLNDKVVLITGGTGSFGEKFIFRLLREYNPKKIIVYSRDEYKQDLLKKKIISTFPQSIEKIRFFIGDVKDKDRLNRAFENVDYVVHAAAMKQVPACEYNPFEAIKTNIYGAQNIIDAAIDKKVNKVIALSTDKAVNPINLYGGTKLVSDKLFISANSYSGGNGTVFSIVRYGNVAGSRGSVIPFFKNIIQSGQNKLPITDERMTRFWITLDQGIDLVLKALKESKGGETYISKIPSFKISDLANAMLEGCELENVGIREGEKLHEVMITKDDSRNTFEYNNHYIIYPYFDWWDSEKYLISTGKAVQEGFEYNSSTNSKWLNAYELKKALKNL